MTRDECAASIAQRRDLPIIVRHLAMLLVRDERISPDWLLIQAELFERAAREAEQAAQIDLQSNQQEWKRARWISREVTAVHAVAAWLRILAARLARPVDPSRLPFTAEA